jgi:hypothetical protein
MSLGSEFVENPPSDRIAAQLNELGTNVCKHGRNPCFVYCGVCQHPSFGWEPLLPERRAQWLGHVLGMTFRDREDCSDRTIVSGKVGDV